MSRLFQKLPSCPACGAHPSAILETLLATAGVSRRAPMTEDDLHWDYADDTCVDWDTQVPDLHSSAEGVKGSFYCSNPLCETLSYDGVIDPTWVWTEEERGQILVRLDRAREAGLNEVADALLHLADHKPLTRWNKPPKKEG